MQRSEPRLVPSVEGPARTRTAGDSCQSSIKDTNSVNLPGSEGSSPKSVRRRLVPGSITRASFAQLNVGSHDSPKREGPPLSSSSTNVSTPYTSRGLFSIEEQTTPAPTPVPIPKTSVLPSAYVATDDEERPLLPSSINSEYGVLPSIEQLRKRGSSMYSRGDPDANRWKFCSNTSSQAMLKSCLYGVINSIILVPVLIGFASIIFRNTYFTSAMPYLVKLVMLSGTIHQLMFTLFSSLPYAIGQVQDAGLIFLSSMASSIVHSTREAGLSHNQIMATVLCWLSLSTAFLGVALWVTGKLNLASLVQYLPMPVVGGYLAYIGLFCMEAGFSLMTGVQINTVLDWKHLFHKDPILLILPGVCLGLGLIFVTQRFRHFLVFPIYLLSIPIFYYIVIGIGGYSLEDARTAHGYGWMAHDSNDTTKFWLVYEHFKFDEIHWASIPSLIPSWIAMYFVVAFSSSLDVAAIQMEVRKTLDFNHELKTVGLANIVSGMTGGFTGSYIFSQTIFTMRAQIDSRAVGFIIVFFEFLFFLLPFSVLAYMPYFWFGAILTFIAIDLMLTWLWRSIRLVSLTEYFVIWATFIAINGLNLEFGMLIGIGISVLLFIFQYSRLHQTEIVIKRSNVMRSFAERTILGDQHTSVVLLKVQGYIFFGSALGILKEVKAALHLPKKEKIKKNVKSVEMINDSAKNPIPLYLILDMRQVTGIDATACRACFVPLKQIMMEYDICMVFTNLRDDVARLLRAHQVLDDNSLDHVRLFPVLDEGLEWCENEILRRVQAEYPTIINSPRATQERDRSSFEDIMSSYFEGDPYMTKQVTKYIRDADRYLDTLHYRPGEMVFEIGDESNAIYFIQTGELVLSRDTSVSADLANTSEMRTRQNCQRLRILRVGHGGIVGELNFILRQPATFRAECINHATCYRLTRERFEEMQEGHAAVANVLHMALQKSLALTVHDHLDSLIT